MTIQKMNATGRARLAASIAQHCNNPDGHDLAAWEHDIITQTMDAVDTTAAEFAYSYEIQGRYTQSGTPVFVGFDDDDFVRAPGA